MVNIEADVKKTLNEKLVLQQQELIAVEMKKKIYL